jgi:5,10-methenyltetrahydrofolate synthetase
MTGDPRIPREPLPLPADKAALRKEMAARRRAIDPDLKNDWDRQIGMHLVEWAGQKQLRSLAVYWPIKGEPDLSPVLTALQDLGISLSLPVVLERDAPLSFAEWMPGEAMLTDGMGIAVPADLRIVHLPEALVIPCVAFNTQGFRLGYGGGFYDRTLEKTPRPLSVGVAYSILQADFPGAPHDVALDCIITESGRGGSTTR